MTLFDTNHNNRQQWIDEIKSITGETDDINVIQFCLSYTLQSLNMIRMKYMKSSNGNN